ncbi:MAG: bifunctional diaminohydroxyphosphoribosylaminopyrimidine deaminase/5-amino-6-(5-phosphoribosylamino)uracil reductase RibD [Opitutales bacterium]
MRRAIDVARRGWGDTHPNPVVGALIIEENEIVAEGYHVKAGELHAERDAFRALGRRPKPGAIMVVTLEPCSTHGRTPPCVDAILENGIETLIVGATDPNPDHRGCGLDLLSDRGVEVISGIEAKACEDLNLIFNHHIQNPNSAFLAAKVATTLDGKIATRSGHSRWITGPEARADVAHWRRYFPSILVGAGTVLADDPSLTSRIDGKDPWCPERLIVDTKGDLAACDERRVFTDPFWENTRVVTASEFIDSPDYLPKFKAKGGRLVQGPLLQGQPYLDWKRFAGWCAGEGLCGVYIEPGAGVMRSLMQQEALDYLFQYVAPKIIGDSEAVSAFSGKSPETMQGVAMLSNICTETFGSDTLIRGQLS